MKAFEKTMLTCYALIVAAIHVLVLLTFEMYTTAHSSLVFWCCAIIIFPISIYYSIRLTKVQGKIWYGYLFTFLTSYLVLNFISYFTVMKTDLLISNMLNPSTTETIPIKMVKKGYVKSSFDHTDVVVYYNNKEVTFETSRTNFFLLEHKKQITANIGVSNTGNFYITKFDHASVEKRTAIKAYLKNWFYRNWWLWAFIILFILFVVISAKYFPNLGTRPKWKPVPFARIVLIWLIIMFSIGVFGYAGLYIYIHFIA